MVEVDQEILEKALNALNKTKELICSALQLTNAVNRGTILPGQFKKNLQVFESDSGNRFNISLDWEQRPDYFKKVVGQDIQSCIINYAIILGKESYSKIPWAQENVDLFAAQKILKFVRDAVGHIYPFATNLSPRGLKESFKKTLIRLLNSIEVPSSKSSIFLSSLKANSLSPPFIFFVISKSEMTSSKTSMRVVPSSWYTFHINCRSKFAIMYLSSVLFRALRQRSRVCLYSLFNEF